MDVKPAYSVDVRFGGQEFEVTNYMEYCVDRIGFKPYYSLPVDVVCNLSRLSYHMPEVKQEVLDALSPFQMISKLWMAGLVRDMIDYEHGVERMAFFGSWFGQQSALMSRQIRGYENIQVSLVDIREEACLAAQFCLDGDDKHRHGGRVKVVQHDALNWEFPPLDAADSVFVQDLVVWNGIEHFPMLQVADYIARHNDVAFALQGTNLVDPEHTNLVNSIEDLMEAIPEERRDAIIYAGHIKCDFATRFTVIVLPQI